MITKTKADLLKGYTMRTSATLLAAGVAAVMMALWVVGPSDAGQVIGSGPTALFTVAANGTGISAPQVMPVTQYYHGPYRHRHGGWWKWRYNNYYPSWRYTYPYKSCYWNGYSYVCSYPKYDVY